MGSHPHSVLGFCLGLAIALKSALSTELQQVAAVDSYRNENYLDKHLAEGLKMKYKPRN